MGNYAETPLFVNEFQLLSTHRKTNQRAGVGTDRLIPPREPSLSVGVRSDRYG